MNCEESTITWMDHGGALVEGLKKLLMNNCMVDCTMAVGDQYLKAHKLVLAACSPYFYQLFTQKTEKDPIIIKDIKYEVLKSLITLLYQGHVKIPAEGFQEFADAAESLQLKGWNISENGGVNKPTLISRNESCDSYNSQENMRIRSVDTGDMNASESNIQCNQNVVKREPGSSEQYIIPDQQPGLQMDIKDEPETFFTEMGCLVVPKEEICVKEMKVREDADDSTDAVKGVTCSLYGDECAEEETPEVDVDNGREDSEVSIEDPTVEPGSPSPVSSSSCTALGASSLATSIEKKQRQGVVDICSALEQTVSLAENVLGDDQSVVKREPEPDPGSETVSAELDCLLDAKEEISVEEMVWDDAEVSADAVSGFTSTPSAGENVKHEISDPVVENSREKCEVSTENSVVVVESPSSIFSSCSSTNAALNTSLPLPDIQEESRLTVNGLSSASEQTVLSPGNVLAPNESSVGNKSELKTEIFASSLTNLVNLKDNICVKVTSTGRKGNEDIRSVTGEISDFHAANQCPGAEVCTSGIVTPSLCTPSSAQNVTATENGSLPEALSSISRPYFPLGMREEGKGVAQQTEDSESQAKERMFEGADVVVTDVVKEGNASNLSKHRFQCDVCKASFSRKGYLSVHVRNHTGERPYQCEVCKASFKIKSNLTQHMRKHTGERPYQCELCKASFADRSSLTVHLRIHTGKRPYQCELCKSSFADSSRLTVHMRIHTGERPYKCELCNRTFSKKSALTVHMRIHTGERPYKCTFCKASFAQSTHLTVHFRKHTGERPSVRDVQDVVCRKI